MSMRRAGTSNTSIHKNGDSQITDKTEYYVELYVDTTGNIYGKSKAQCRQIIEFSMLLKHDYIT